MCARLMGTLFVVSFVLPILQQEQLRQALKWNAFNPKTSLPRPAYQDSAVYFYTTVYREPEPAQWLLHAFLNQML